MMSSSETGQVSRSAANVYDTFFVPAFFQHWATRVAEAADVRSGQVVLDVACGTGVLAREVARRIGSSGEVVGIDLNEGMLAVAQQRQPAIEWRLGRAEALPFAADHFDVVLSQFGLMFFEDRHTALREMLRVVRPGGRLAIAVWDALERSPGYAAMANLLERLFGAPVASALQAPFALGDRALLQSLFVEAGMPEIHINTEEGIARFPSIASWVTTEITGWTLADVLDAAAVERVLQEAESALRPFVTVNGSVEFRMPAHIVTATKE